jgi:RNA polymerase sigma-70 factor (ECF subfamily)
MLVGDCRFDAVYRHYAPVVHRRARAMLGSETDAWEVVQDVFMSFYERPKQFEGRSQLSSFLYAVTTNACLNRIRSRKTRARLLHERGNEAPAPQPCMPLDPEALSLLHDVLRRLPEPLGLVALYYYIDDLSQSEIAQLIGFSRKHVGNLLERVVEAALSLEVPC